MKKSTKNSIRLFVATFLSTSLFIFGAGTLLFMFAPAVAEVLQSVDYHPELPLSGDRTEAFLDINSVPAKQLYPPLTSVDTVETGNWIRIPSANINVPLALSPSINDDDVIETLDLGAALYPNGISPGRLGNTFIAAHSTGEPWKGKYRFAFLNINDVQSGHVIHLDYEGTRYTYRVFKKDIVTPHPDFKIVSDRPIPTVTLMACWPLWTTQQRMLITAELTNVTQLTEKPL